MREIKIKFVDYFEGFDAKNCKIVEILKKRYKVVFSDQPEYLFFTVFSDQNLLYDCVKIFISGENLAPDFNLCDYAMSSERLNFGDRHFYYPYFLSYFSDLDLAQKKHLNANKLDCKRDFCSFVVSNDRADSIRKQVFDLLSSYKKVDSGGKYQNNIGGSVSDKLEFESHHKFSIAFENSSHVGYVTEKIVQAFAARTVPIYWGDASISDIFNPKSFINAKDFISLNDLLTYIEKVDNDDSMYFSYLTAPAFLNENYVNDKWKDYEDFLYHIIEQPYEDAFRRNRVFWGKLYQEKLLRWKEAYEHPLRQVCRRVKNHIKR